MTTACVSLLYVLAGAGWGYVLTREWTQAQLTSEERKQRALEIVNRRQAPRRV